VLKLLAALAACRNRMSRVTQRSLFVSVPQSEVWAYNL
jgi:hypothetical protein